MNINVVVTKLAALADAERSLTTRGSRTERACHKAAVDAYETALRIVTFSDMYAATITPDYTLIAEGHHPDDET